MTPETVVLDRPRFNHETIPKFAHLTCQGCGKCSSVCPVAGIDGFDPRKVVRIRLEASTVNTPSVPYRCKS